VLEGMRDSLMQGAGLAALAGYLVPLLVIGLISIPVGVAIFGWAERSAKRNGRLKRSG
jgi:ABC-2 type transport system permease protein